MTLALLTPARAPASLGSALIDLVTQCVFTPQCTSGDLNDDGAVTVADIVAAVRGPLDGATPTATGTPTDSPSPLPTATETTTTTTTPTDTVSATPTITDTPPPSATATISPTPTDTGTITATPTATDSPTRSPTATASLTPSRSPTPATPATHTRTPTSTQTPTASPTTTATHSASPSRTPTRTPTSSPSATPSRTPTLSVTPTRSPSATPTSSPTSQPTPTVPQVIDGAAAAIAVITAGLADFPMLLADGIAASGCPLGGTAARVCNEIGVPREITATFDNCEIPAPAGSLVVDGSVTLTADNGTCPNVLLLPVTQIVNLKLLYRDSEGTMQRAVAAELTADVTAQRGLDSPCFYTGISAVVSGTIQVQVDGGAGVDARIEDVEIVADVATHTAECLPIEDVQTLEGVVSFTELPAERGYPIELQSYEAARVASAFGNEVEISGKAAGPCFGGGATLTTAAVVQVPLTDICPSGGTIVAETTFAPPRTLFYGEGQVAVDEDGDGLADTTYPTCTAAPACSE